MITLLLTQDHWQNADLADLEREVIGALAEAELDPCQTAHPHVRATLAAGTFFDFYRIQPRDIRVRSTKYHPPSNRGWTQLRYSKLIRTPGKLVEVLWTPRPLDIPGL